MPAYAVAQLQDLNFGPDIVAYIEAVDATLAPFGGQFLVHGAQAEILEGPWAGSLVVVAFPGREQAKAWYASAAYQDILPLRTRNARCWVILVDGVGEGHRATDILAQMPPSRTWEN